MSSMAGSGAPVMGWSSHTRLWCSWFQAQRYEKKKIYRMMCCFPSVISGKYGYIDWWVYVVPLFLLSLKKSPPYSTLWVGPARHVFRYVVNYMRYLTMFLHTFVEPLKQIGPRYWGDWKEVFVFKKITHWQRGTSVWKYTGWLHWNTVQTDRPSKASLLLLSADK